MSRPPYQDKWRDGVLVEKGRRECADRFRVIFDHVGPVETVVDVGGWDGYFARRFAELGSECVLVEPRNVADLPERVVHRQDRVSADTVLPDCDAALALAVLHHMEDWEGVYRALRCASSMLIVEAAHPTELDGPLSPTLVDTGHRIGPVYERVMNDGVVVAETPGPNGVQRPIVAISNTMDGSVEDGLGRACGLMDDRLGELADLLGYEPHPGTLNAKVGRSGKAWVKNLPGPVQVDGRGGMSGPYWPVTVAGIAGHVRTSKSQTTVEVVAPFRLRDQGIANDDIVTLRPR